MGYNDPIGMQQYLGTVGDLQTSVSWTSSLATPQPVMYIPVKHPTPTKEASMKLVRYYAYYPNVHVAKLDSDAPVLLDGTALVAGADEQRIILDLTEDLDAALAELNTYLADKMWTNPEGDPKPFATVRRSDVEFNISLIKSF